MVTQAGAAEAGHPPSAAAGTVGEAASPQAIAEYRSKLKNYLAARDGFEQQETAYWNQIAEKRRARSAKRRDRQQITLNDYVLTQPPVYAGPKRPRNPAPESEPEATQPERKHNPTIADLLKAAADNYRWAPQQPASEVEFMRAYARYASNAGLTGEQAVRVYAFETGGDGTHKSESDRSTAVGYNQLLTTNSVELLAEQGPSLVKSLTERAANLTGPARQAMEQKVSVLKKMVAQARSVPDDWSEHGKIADTPEGWAMHAMVLDVDVGPMLQTHKLLTSVLFARERGFARPLTAAELEMMNLTGDGNGFDMVTMPQPMREQVPTSNFFQRGGYERNPVAIRHNTVAKLLAVTDARMDENSNTNGAKELAAAFVTATSASASAAPPDSGR